MINAKNNVYFWKVLEKNCFLSNWWICEIDYDGKKFVSSEQLFMYLKAKLFYDDEVAEKIMQTSRQNEIKALGREVKNFDETIWNKHKYELMFIANKAKFRLDYEITDMLLATGDAQLVEASPLDKIWGIGLDAETAENTPEEDWPGENLLGKVLMDVRDLIKHIKEQTK